jgi:uncharacterized protein YfaT (DUF1175 family)
VTLKLCRMPVDPPAQESGSAQRQYRVCCSQAVACGINELPEEVVQFCGVQDENLRVFFGRFLIGHLAPTPDTDDQLGFTPPEPLALSDGYP